MNPITDNMSVQNPSIQSRTEGSSDRGCNYLDEVGTSPEPTEDRSASFQQKLSHGIVKSQEIALNKANSQSNLHSCGTTSNVNMVKEKTSFILNPSRLSPVVAESLNKVHSKHNDSRQSVNNGELLKFVPLFQSCNNKPVVSNKQTSTIGRTVLSTDNSFIFGQNLKERVTSETKINNPTADTVLNTNGIPDMLFSSAIKHERKSDKLDANKETKTLSESAREYEQSRAVKRKYEEVEIRTGEEEETNILSMSCKLFAYDTSSGSWQERGRGILRLNDFDADDMIQSRVVIRTSGSLRVVLNTKIWAEMTVEKASDKSVRLTALDANGEVKVFLVMANIEDTKQLHSLLQTRLNREITLQKRKKLSDTAKDIGPVKP